MSELVILTGSVDAATAPQAVFMGLENGTPSAAVAFKGIDTGSVVWAPTFNSGVSWFSAPGGGVFVGVVSNQGQVSGTITLNQAIDVPVVLVLTGSKGQIGKASLPAGQTSVSFSIPVSQGDGLSALDVAANIQGYFQGTFPPGS